jgi:hypothetical protein
MTKSVPLTRSQESYSEILLRQIFLVRPEKSQSRWWTGVTAWVRP